jgi:aspartyl-tRNA synthetase
MQRHRGIQLFSRCQRLCVSVRGEERAREREREKRQRQNTEVEVTSLEVLIVANQLIFLTCCLNISIV